MAERDPGRRKFLDWLLGTSAAALAVAVVYPVLRYIVPPAGEESAASSVTLDFGPGDIAANTGRIFKFGSKAGILVKTASGELRAFSGTCTHLGCIVQYRPDFGHVWCACHNGHFDLNGINIQGPPPAPLEQYAVNIRGDQIVVSKRA
jgi:cytochrome b6-f complex iron-sulfur subunit